MKKLLIGAVLVVMSSPALAQSGIASWYQMGHRTANSEKYRPDGLTCAHKTLPFNTRVRVTYSGRSVICRINDRGPFTKGRVLDLSRGAAKTIGLTRVGVAKVQYQVLGR